MQISVRNIAELHSGIYTNISSFRGESVYYLQIRHWDKERRWAEYIEPELREDRRLMKNYLRAGDLLLATKGVVPFAALYDGQYQPAIASSVFTVIRIMDSVAIMPAYLQWYLNHPATIQTLIAASRGTSIPLITRDVIEGLLVPVPPIKKQERIIRLQRLQQQAIRLRMRINELNESLFQNRLLEIANGE